MDSDDQGVENFATALNFSRKKLVQIEETRSTNKENRDSALPVGQESQELRDQTLELNDPNRLNMNFLGILDPRKTIAAITRQRRTTVSSNIND